MRPFTRRPRRPLLAPLMLLLAAASVTGCDTLFGPGDGPPPELTALPRQLSAAEREVISASNGFAFELLRESRRQDPAPNIFLSPISASMALGMALNGAQGETLDGMRAALGFGGLELQRINESYRDLIALLRGLDTGVDMIVANSIWARSGFPFHDSFFQTARTYFDAEVATLDFTAPSASGTINGWVDASTKGRIKEIVPTPLPDDIVMYLINAIYFKGRWRDQFDRSRTVDAPFTLDDGTQKTVRMMNRSGTLAHRLDPARGVWVAELPYSRGAFVMTVVVPAGNGALDDVIDALTPALWDAWTQDMPAGETMFAMPRFRMEYEALLNEPLIAMGMELAFDQTGRADFTGLSPLGHELFISEVKQKTFVEVNEEGTEAAAVTSVGIGPTSAPPMIRLDRPYLLAIRERFSGTILFLGRIGDPDSR